MNMYFNPAPQNTTKLSTTPLGRYCADPNLTIIDGRYVLYCTDDGIDDWATTSLSVYVSDDLAHWQRTPILDLHDVPWWKGEAGAWAPSVTRNTNGDYVLFFVADSRIGTAVSHSPFGPFEATPQPLIDHDDFHMGNIDPSVFITETGKPYLLWGNTQAYASPLSDDCLSIDRRQVISRTPDNFREAIWLHQRNGLYYASWSENDTRDPEYRVRYSMSESPQGPWSEPKTLISQDSAHGIYATGHHSITNIPGTDEWVIAYHRFAYGPHGRRWNGGDGSHREIVFAPLTYDAEGNIRRVMPQVGSYIRPLSF